MFLLLLFIYLFHVQVYQKEQAEKCNHAFVIITGLGFQLFSVDKYTVIIHLYDLGQCDIYSFCIVACIAKHTVSTQK